MAESFKARFRRAFQWHWNLLFLGGGLVVGLLSDAPSVILPAVVAAELAYLGFLGLNQRFQNVLRGEKLLKAANDGERLSHLLGFLSARDRGRFENLQRKCRELTALQRRLDDQRASEGRDRFRTESLDKLLWLFLKLLYQKSGAERFLAQTDRTFLGKQLAAAEEEVSRVVEEGGKERLVESLQEKKAILESRVANYDHAHENLELLAAEIDNTEQKIVHLCEVGMTNRDASTLSRQIDGIAESVTLSEQTLDELHLEEYFPADEDVPPPLVSEDSDSSSRPRVELE